MRKISILHIQNFYFLYTNIRFSKHKGTILSTAD